MYLNNSLPSISDYITKPILYVNSHLSFAIPMEQYSMECLPTIYGFFPENTIAVTAIVFSGKKPYMVGKNVIICDIASTLWDRIRHTGL